MYFFILLYYSSYKKSKIIILKNKKKIKYFILLFTEYYLLNFLFKFSPKAFEILHDYARLEKTIEDHNLNQIWNLKPLLDVSFYCFIYYNLLINILRI
jgi:hypothetical protein